MWDRMTECIQRISKEVFGKSKGRGLILKDTWWQNDEVQAAVKVNNDCFKKWQKDRNNDNFKSYKCANKYVKRILREAKMKAYRLITRDGEKHIYKLAKLRGRERKTRDVNEVKCTKGDNSRVLVKDEEIKDLRES